jgi:hypothetical protein
MIQNPPDAPSRMRERSPDPFTRATVKNLTYASPLRDQAAVGRAFGQVKLVAF